tara:strand:+ start:6481 stop:6912 length:432 start_codon:yes stop_codon:yes gene_type:complete
MMGYRIYQIDREWRKSLGEDWRKHDLSYIEFSSRGNLADRWKPEYLDHYKHVVSLNAEGFGGDSETDLWKVYHTFNMHSFVVSGEDIYENVISDYETKTVERDGEKITYKMYHSLSIGDIVEDLETGKKFILHDDFVDLQEIN